MAESDLPDPGWYPDPHGAAPLRWWTGTVWSEETADPPVAPPATAPAVLVASSPDPGFYRDPHGVAPYRWWSGTEWGEETAESPVPGVGDAAEPSPLVGSAAPDAAPAPAPASGLPGAPPAAGPGSPVGVGKDPNSAWRTVVIVLGGLVLVLINPTVLLVAAIVLVVRFFSGYRPPWRGPLYKDRSPEEKAERAAKHSLFKDPRTCDECGGSGQVRWVGQYGDGRPLDTVSECEKCHGSGSTTPLNWRGQLFPNHRGQLWTMLIVVYLVWSTWARFAAT